MSEEIVIKYYVKTDKVGSKCEYQLTMDRKEWEIMCEDEQEEIVKEEVFNMVDWGYEVHEQ